MGNATIAVKYQTLWYITWEGHIIVIIQFIGMCLKAKISHNNYRPLIKRKLSEFSIILFVYC